MTRAFLPFLLCLASNARGFSVLHSLRLPGIRFLQTSFTSLPAKPTGGSVVDSYQTVSVNCSSCSERLFRYKKKNGTKSNLVKCYVERIVDDCAGILACAPPNPPTDYDWECPTCHTKFARTAVIHGRPALKLVGGKIRMTKK
jgi:hypothetical protein